LSDSIRAPFRNHDQIREIAADFLRKFHPKHLYPIPIEEIVELSLQIDIIPVPNMHKVFGIDGFLSSDRKSISVDERIYNSRPGRYRFTLAHEVGHLILHKDIFEMHRFKTIKEWESFVTKFPLGEYNWFEWQAYEFAGLVLVPDDHLERRLKHHVKRIRSLGIDDDEVIADRAIEFLAGDFIVSKDVIFRRLKKMS